MRISPNWIVWGAFISVLTTTIAASAQTTEIKLGEKGIDADRHASAVTQTIDTPPTGSHISTISTDIPNINVNPTDLPDLTDHQNELKSTTLQTSLSRDIEDTSDADQPDTPKLSWLDRGDRLNGKGREPGLVGIGASEAIDVEIASSASDEVNQVESTELAASAISNQQVAAIAPAQSLDHSAAGVEVDQIDQVDQSVGRAISAAMIETVAVAVETETEADPEPSDRNQASDANATTTIAVGLEPVDSTDIADIDTALNVEPNNAPELEPDVTTLEASQVLPDSEVEVSEAVEAAEVVAVTETTDVPEATEVTEEIASSDATRCIFTRQASDRRTI
jgi:hypothetical protein